MKRMINVLTFLGIGLLMGCAPAPEGTDADLEQAKEELRQDQEALQRYLDERDGEDK